MIQFVYYVLFAMLLVYGMYYVVTGLFAFVKPKRFCIRPAEAKHRFAVLIAARNEAQVIGSLIDSLRHQHYPQDLYEIIVIANHCTDDTARVCERAGATVLHCDAPVHTKGDVLKWTYEKLKERRDIDAYVIFDADNLVHPDFLKEMNHALCSGYRVAQGFRDSKNASDNWLSGSYSLFYYMQNFFFNQARMTTDSSASINGTGFMVQKEVIDNNGFDPKTLTEDIEFTAMCALRHEKIAFVKQAVTYDEQPLRFCDSWKQRKRWSTGTMQCLRQYGYSLAKDFLHSGNQASLDMLMNFLSPLMQILSLVAVLMLTAFSYLGIELYDLFSYLFAYGILFFLLTYLAGVVINAAILCYNRRDPRAMVGAVLLFAFFILTWIPINVTCLNRKPIAWAPIRHTRNLRMEDLSSHL